METIDKNSEEIQSILRMVEEMAEAFSCYKQTSRPLLNGELFLNNKDLSRILKISERSLQDYRDQGKLAFYKIEGRILYKQSDILKYLEDNYFEQFIDNI